jgi:hypothetical protein
MVIILVFAGPWSTDFFNCRTFPNSIPDTSRPPYPPPRHDWQVPVNGHLHALLEPTFRLPAEFFPGFGCIDGIAPVMPEPVLDKGDERSARLPRFGIPSFAVEGIADEGDHLDILQLVVAADVIAPGRSAPFQGLKHRLAVIPTYSQSRIFCRRRRPAGLFLQDVVEDQRDQLFRELVRSVIVGAIGDQHRQAVGMEIGTDQVVGGGLGGRIGIERWIVPFRTEGWSVW